MMNNNSLFAIRLLKDTEGNYLWRPGLELGQPSSLAGYGIAENEQMPDIAADAKAIAFGLSLIHISLLSGCGSTRTVYVSIPVVPLPATLTAETPYPDIPDNMTWGNSLNLNVSLLSALGQCNRDKADIRQAEKKRAGF